MQWLLSRQKTGLGIILSWAKMIGLCIALGVGANECFQMMLGRRGLDVMKLPFTL